MASMEAEAAMLARDACEIHDMVLRLSDKRHGGILGICIPPFVSFFVVEAYDWLRRNQDTGAYTFLELEAVRVRRARRRLKLFDDAAGFDASLKHLKAIEDASHRMFQADGRGVLGTVRRWLSTDFGCYFLGPDLVCTTHVALANFGFGDDELGEVTNDSIPTLSEDVRSFADQLGKFLADKFPLSSHAADDAGLLRKLPPLRQEDHRALDAYSRLAARLGVDDVQLAVQFSYLVSQVNFVHLGLPSLLRPDSDLLFRFQFLTMFHVSGELRRLGAVTGGVRSHKLGRFAADVQSRSGVRKLRSLKRLRNAMAHYDSRGLGVLATDDRYFDAMVAQGAGVDRVELSHILNRELEFASNCCRSIVAKGSLRRTRRPG
jgi:hypothetical protein